MIDLLALVSEDHLLRKTDYEWLCERLRLCLFGICLGFLLFPNFGSKQNLLPHCAALAIEGIPPGDIDIPGNLLDNTEKMM